MRYQQFGRNLLCRTRQCSSTDKVFFFYYYYYSFIHLQKLFYSAQGNVASRRWQHTLNGTPNHHRAQMFSLGAHASLDVSLRTQMLYFPNKLLRNTRILVGARQTRELPPPSCVIGIRVNANSRPKSYTIEAQELGVRKGRPSFVSELLATFNFLSLWRKETFQYLMEFCILCAGSRP